MKNYSNVIFQERAIPRGTHFQPQRLGMIIPSQIDNSRPMIKKPAINNYQNLEYGSFNYNPIIGYNGR